MEWSNHLKSLTTLETMPINGLFYFLWVVLGIRIYIYIFFFLWERISYILPYNTLKKKNFCIKKKITIISPLHNILWLTFPCTRREVSCLTVSGKKKKKKVEEVSWKTLTWNTRDSMTVTKAKIRQAHICILLLTVISFVPPLLFSFSLSNYWTRRRWTKAVQQRLFSQI